MRPPEAHPIEVPAPEIWAQVNRLYAHWLFARSENLKALLSHILKLRLSGVTDPSAYSGDTLGIDVFRKRHATHLGKIEGNKLRDRLDRYYETDGRTDLCVISIPKGTYRPDVYYNQNLFPLLNEKAADYVYNAKTGMNRRTPAGYDSAFAFLNLALQEHPDHPRVLALKALVHLNRALFNPYPRTELESAERIISSMHAQASPALAWEAWLADGCIKERLHWDWDQATESYEKAISLSRGEAMYYQGWYPGLLACRDKLPEAIAILRTTVENFAHDIPVIRGDLAMCQIMDGKYPEAQRSLDAMLALFPLDPNWAYIYLAVLKEATGDFAGAASTIQQVPVDAPEGMISIGLRYAFIGLAGDRMTARKGFEDLKAARELVYVPATQIAMAAMGCKDYDAAVEWLKEGAVAQRDPICTWLNILPFLRHLRNHKGFCSLVTEEMGLNFSQS